MMRILLIFFGSVSLGLISSVEIETIEKHDEYLKVGQTNVSYLLRWPEGKTISQCKVEIPGNGEFTLFDNQKSPTKKASYYDGGKGGFAKGYCGATITKIGDDYHGPLNFELSHKSLTINTNDLVKINLASTPKITSLKISENSNDENVHVQCTVEEMRPYTDLWWSALKKVEIVMNKTKQDEEDFWTVTQEIKTKNLVGRAISCNVENELFEEPQMRSLIMEGKPTNSKGEFQYNSESKTLIAFVEFWSFPKPKPSKWQLGGKEIHNDTTHNSELQELEQNRYKSIFTKTNANSIEDFNGLKLIVKNSKGETEYSFELSTPDTGVGVIVGIIIGVIVIIIAGIAGFLGIKKRRNNKNGQNFRLEEAPMNK